MNFLLRSNIFIGLCAAALTLSTFYLFGIPINWWYVAFMFTATIFGYTMLRLGKFILNEAFPNLFKGVTILSGLTAGFCLTALPKAGLHWPAILVAVFLSIWYGSHHLGGQLGKFSLRQPGWVKLATIGIVWAITTAALPLLLQQTNTTLTTYQWLFIAQQFVFITMLTIPFDLKDQIREKALGIRSLPVIVGKQNALKIAKILALTYWVLGGFGGLTTLFSASICSILFVAWINRTSEKDTLNNTMVKFDGLILIQSLFIILFTIIK